MTNLQLTTTEDNRRKINFDKYDHAGSYHWNVLSRNIFKQNIVWKARYYACLRIMKNELGEVRGKRILDMGCGDGVLSFLLSRAGAEVYGVDSSNLALSLAVKRHAQYGSNVKFELTDACDTHFPDSFFDGVVASELIEHVQQPDCLLQEIKRVLQSSGIGIISTPVRVSQEVLDKYHYQEWFPEDFKILVENIFPDATYEFSHPVFWTGLFYRSRWNKFMLQLISLVRNPFATNNCWKFFRQQYAIVKKQKDNKQKQ